MLLVHRSFGANAPPTCAYLRGTSAEVLPVYFLCINPFGRLLLDALLYLLHQLLNRSPFGCLKGREKLQL